MTQKEKALAAKALSPRRDQRRGKEGGGTKREEEEAGKTKTQRSNDERTGEEQAKVKREQHLGFQRGPPPQY